MSTKAEDEKRLWHEIGLHRSLASFWFNFILLLIAAVPALLLFMWVFPNYILPYPEALGFRTLTIGYFALFFSIMDFATGPACVRFVSQYAEINPKKALHYVQFFIWFQMTTGLIQVTIVTVYCFTIIVNTDLNYAMWFFLIYSITQFPGMLGSFNSTLKGFQRYDKSNIVDILQTVVFEVVTQLIFILLGRWWGRNDPQIGELMGATIGFIVGKYVDDFFAMMVSGKFVSNLIKPYGLRLRDCIIPQFTKEEAKESLVFGGKLLGAELISWATEYATLMMMISWVPNYIHILGYLEIAKTVAGIVTTKYDFSAMMSESYNNGKKKLSEYLVTANLKHWWYLAFFLALEISIMVPPILSKIGGTYGEAAWIIPIYVLPRLLVMPPVIGADLLQACHRPEYRTLGIVVEKVTKMITVFLFLSPNGIVRYIGIENIIILYVLHDIPAYIAITIAEFYFLNKKCIPVRINYWQTFGAGTLASLPMLPINYAIIHLFNIVYLSGVGIGGLLAFALGFIIVGLFVFPLILFFVYGLVGGWDDYGLAQFHKTALLSGPSKFIVMKFYQLTAMGHRISPLKNRFPIPHEDAQCEIDELNSIRVSP